MAQKSKEFSRVKFPFEIIQEGYNVFQSSFPKKKGYRFYQGTWRIVYPDHSWNLDSEDQFALEYSKNDIQSASINYTWFDKEAKIFDFNVSYRRDYTEISITLGSIGDIEKVFAVFESNYSKFAQAEKEIQKEIQREKPRYKIDMEIPSVTVSKELLQALENYFFKRVSQVEKIQIPEIQSHYDLFIGDSDGTQTLPTVNDIDSLLFPDNIQWIKLDYSAPYNGNLDISVYFSRHRSLSAVKISYKGENSKNISQGILKDIYKILDDYKANYWMYQYPVRFLGNILVGLLLVFILISKDSLWRWVSVSIILVTSIFLTGTGFVPYSVFDTKRNREVNRWTKFLVEGFIGFIIFSVLGGLLLRLLGLF